MMLEITKITILSGRGTDTLFLHSNLPEGTYPYKDKASLKLDVAHKWGSRYCAENFPNVPTETITDG